MILKEVSSTLKSKTVFCIFLSLFIFAAESVSAQNYPEITELKSRNVLFSQYQEDVERANMDIAAGRTPVMTFYSYTAGKDDTMFTVASRCSVIYDSIVTINDIQDTDTKLEGRKLILPTVSGLFIPFEPFSPIEQLLSREFADLTDGNIPVYTVNGRKFYFLAGQRFSQAERAFFINPGMVLPLEQSVLSSSFGMRVSPISGQWKFHHGIDMAASLGSKVMSCKNGIVDTIVMNDPTYGNYVVIKHSDSMTSLYAHLGVVSVKEGQTVRAGQEIGKVGLTGLTTGPHLHFEIHVNGNSRDPQDFY